MSTPRITTREDGDVTVLDVAGEIIVGDEGFSPAFVAAVQAVLEAGRRRIVVCLDARHLTSTALGAVIESSQVVRARGGALAAYSARPTLRAVFKVLVHTGIFFNTEEEARSVLKKALAGAPGATPSGTSSAPGRSSRPPRPPESPAPASPPRKRRPRW